MSSRSRLTRSGARARRKKLFKLSNTTKQWQIKELEQLTSAARHSYLAYIQLYDEFTA